MWKPVLCLLLSVCLFTPAGQAVAIEAGLEPPGPLSTVHEEFAKDCSLCHTFVAGSTQRGLCFNCHEQIAQDISIRQGFHGRNPEVFMTDCGDCHSEHEGRNASIIFFVPSSFDHQFTDFTLQGIHRQLDCVDCHNRQRLKSDLQTASRPIKYRNVANSCIDCHGDDEPHQGAFGRDCSLCHQPGAWNELGIDHSLFAFPLIGVHTELACVGCHTEAPKPQMVRTCRDCHFEDDAHDQRLSLDCSRCHNPNGWDRWQFNHTQQTTFPLSGAHQDLECIACHTTPVAGQFQLSKDCVDCHQKDYPHRGEFSLDCDRCHQSTRFKNVKLSN